MCIFSENGKFRILTNIIVAVSQLLLINHKMNDNNCVTIVSKPKSVFGPLNCFFKITEPAGQLLEEVDIYSGHAYYEPEPELSGDHDVSMEDEASVDIDASVDCVDNIIVQNDVIVKFNNMKLADGQNSQCMPFYQSVARFCWHAHAKSYPSKEAIEFNSLQHKKLKLDTLAFERFMDLMPAPLNAAHHLVPLRYLGRSVIVGPRNLLHADHPLRSGVWSIPCLQDCENVSAGTNAINTSRKEGGPSF